SRHQLGREKFLEKVWEWKEEYGNKILEQLKKIGASCDWSRTRFTMDEEYKKAVEEAFLHYHKKGWIYQGERVVNWCVRCQTSLSDLELEYEEEKGKLYFIRYPFKRDANIRTRANDTNKKEWITVATTRPETMLGDTAVAVNPKDERYENLVGKILVLPIQNREIPIVADESVDKDFGTGAVKVTPSHSLADAEIAGRHKLPEIKIINEIGKMTKEAGAEFEGENVKNAREKVVAKLAELGLLEKTDDYIHRVAKCYRCGAVIEPQPSKQWFLKMNELAKMAVKAVEDGKVKFSDERWEKIYSDWLSNIRDWCVSRQIWWGHQLPIYFCKSKLEEIKNEKLKIKSEENFAASAKKPEKCPFCGDCEMEQSQDVLDTWFSSALWPFATLGWPSACAQVKSEKLKVKSCKPKEGSDLEKFYPTQFLSTARDIINLWVARMIFSGLEFMGEAPFQDVFIHPTVLAKSGQRMSKSLGTGI
ncbi:MAG: class I tRNA ligase family protein, partial [Patescibacteria group bacterium]